MSSLSKPVNIASRFLTHEVNSHYVNIKLSRSNELTELATPLQFGVTFPIGKCRRSYCCRVELSSHDFVVGQLSPLGFWKDGSVRWALVDCVVPTGIELPNEIRIAVQDAGSEAPTHPISVQRSAKHIDVSNDHMLARFHTGNGAWEIMCQGKAAAHVPLPVLVDSRKRTCQPIVGRVDVSSQGPVRGSICIGGGFQNWPGINFLSEWNFFAGCNSVRGSVTLHNSRRAQHRGGLWDLGDQGSLLFEDLSQLVVFNAQDRLSIRYRSETDQPMLPVTSAVEIYQESSGGINWDSRNHVNRKGIVPLRFSGYRGFADESSLSGSRAQPAVEISSPHIIVCAEIDQFWQQFPKLISAQSNVARLGLFPREFGDLHELQGGEQKSHSIWLDVSRSTTPSSVCTFESEIRNFEQCPNGQEGQSKEAHTGEAIRAQSLCPLAIPGLPNWLTADVGRLSTLDSLADEFLNSPQGLFANRELVDEYGWRSFGDIHADHEEQYYRGPKPLISHYNNQFDVLCGFLLQFLRTGENQWIQLADALAHHVMDIDVYHTSQDRPAYNGGLFWFTDHYLHAETSTHRTYSKRNQVPGQNYGGGPAAAHNFTTGLLLYHLLTGNNSARNAVLELSNWVIAQDDGSQTIWGLIDAGPTGNATATSAGGIHGPSRTGGNSINALLDGWLLTRDSTYLQYAELLIHRCVHPKLDIADFDLLNIEKSWSYTVFLVSLDKYLRCKEAEGDLDMNYAFARDCLVHYGQWMLHHERPYFDRVAELEYPTEAWAAQEFRKANVLRLAARYADGDLAERMLQKGNDLADRAWSDLLRFSTRTAARAMAVVFVEGLRDAELIKPISPPPIVSGLNETGRFIPFYSQRDRIRRNLRSPAGIFRIFLRALTPSNWPCILKHR